RGIAVDQQQRRPARRDRGAYEHVVARETARPATADPILQALRTLHVIPLVVLTLRVHAVCSLPFPPAARPWCRARAAASASSSCVSCSRSRSSGACSQAAAHRSERTSS